jgi:hypothetical protein
VVFHTEGSHFRYGTVRWSPTQRTITSAASAPVYEAEFRLQLAYRKNYAWGTTFKEAWRDTSDPLADPPNPWQMALAIDEYDCANSGCNGLVQCFDTNCASLPPAVLSNYRRAEDTAADSSRGRTSPPNPAQLPASNTRRGAGEHLDAREVAIPHSWRGCGVTRTGENYAESSAYQVRFRTGMGDAGYDLVPNDDGRETYIFPASGGASTGKVVNPDADDENTGGRVCKCRFHKGVDVTDDACPERTTHLDGGVLTTYTGLGTDNDGTVRLPKYGLGVILTNNTALKIQVSFP